MSHSERSLWAETALLPGGWADGVRVTVVDGRIVQVRPATPPEAGDARVGVLLAAPMNAHSHAFQRAMAGLTERRGPEAQDSFWTWRDLMFRFLTQLTPDDVESITAFVQVELLEAGYAGVCEFHYLHHQPDGTPYDALGELATRIVAATHRTGAGLTLLPVLYEVGGCDGRPLAGGQRRFGNSPERFARLAEEAWGCVGSLPADAGVGLAPHSLRAVTLEGLAAAVTLAADRPVHLHLAEQPGEVAEVLAAHGARPGEWLLDQVEVDARWTLIHCTQLMPHETQALAATGAVAGLCPLTEASLGDGIFDAVGWLAHAGRFAVGSDSHIRIALAEELRALETSQRLRDHARAVLATPAWSTGRVLYEGILRGGAAAAGRASGAIAPGRWADLLALDATATAFVGRSGDTLLDTWIFSGDDRLVTDVWSAGRHVVTQGRHRDRPEIEARYRRTIARLQDLL